MASVVLACIVLTAHGETDEGHSTFGEPLDVTPSASPMDLERATASFYLGVGENRVWLGHPERLEQLRRVLLTLYADGLVPEHYGLPLIQNDRQDHDEQETAALDRRLTRGFLLAMLHVYRGKVDPHDLDPVWNVERRVVDVEAAIEAAAEAVREGRIEDFAQAARPQHPVYRRLRNSLQRLRDVEALGGWPNIGAGPTIDPGTRDPRVPMLRHRLALAGYLSDADDEDTADFVYDDALESAVRIFQAEQYLTVDGRVGRATISALDVPLPARIGQMRANLERSRWLLHQLSGDFVLVDIAGYRVHFVHAGEPIFSTRVQVGQPLRRTPIFRAEITHLTLNPTWIVPPTILAEDALPAIRRNRQYLSKNHLHVIDPTGRELDPKDVDWRNPPADLFLRQDAGPKGALGRIVIRFPNPHAVYLHETPHAGLFSYAQRAFSAGCIRVEHPFELATLLLGADSGWTREALDAAIATGEKQDVPLLRPVPILLMYWTASSHSEGRVAFKPDVYGLDAAVLEALDREPVFVREDPTDLPSQRELPAVQESMDQQFEIPADTSSTH